ncbi:molybdenum cofactor biosynthesis protein B [Alteribacillus sp. HJP-4]|uniref:MogA/MoaB family molybdenum cofactor biosynthesis protein n=1 Tax=Alteribacillus sp. HJP-4 TaxID=2775394 RepID=UPI0035CD3CD8
MSVSKHREEAPETLNCMVITVSDTRTKENDKSGKVVRDALKSVGYFIPKYHVVKDEYEDIQHLIKEGGNGEDIDAIIINGGTGIADRDTTFEAVRDLLEKEMPGFGELFRYLSYVEDIGSASILSRAVAGVYHHKAIFSMPGSSGAVCLAMERIIVPELAHVVREIRKDLS